jgi:hypothetical protein
MIFCYVQIYWSFYAIFVRRKGTYLWTCGSFKSENRKKLISKSQIRNGHICGRCINHQIILVQKIADLRFAELIADRPALTLMATYCLLFVPTHVLVLFIYAH